MDKIRVLLVEDEPTLAIIIKDTLDGEAFEVILAANGEEGLSRYREAKPDIIVTDIMMPKIDGFTMVRHIRKTDRQIPVLFLSARSAANDVVEGFELGGNDYLKKPFGMAELIIRIKALLNKISVRKEESSNFTLGQYTFDSITQTLQYCGEKQLLSNRESEILKRLCENKDHVLPMKDVLLELWGDDSFFNARSLHVFITKLRHKLSKDESIKILNVRGIGYKLICFNACANWSGHDVPRSRQSMPSRRRIASPISIPTSSLDKPCVFPWQPPMICTFLITLSSESTIIILEHTPPVGV